MSDPNKKNAADTGVAPYHPLHTLKPFGADLWIADGGIVRMSYLGGSMPFSTRMVVVRLTDGSLWLWSPVEADEALIAEIDALGPVAHIVSPNAIHYANIPAWTERYPQARVWASPGVRERAAAQGVEIMFTDDLGDGPPPAWDGQIDQVVFRGSRILEEVVFHHRASRTLILADLIENFEADRLSRAYRFFARIAGVVYPDGKAPLDLRLGYLGRKARAREALATMLGWNPIRVIVAHGRCYEENGRAEIERAFNWLR